MDIIVQQDPEDRMVGSINHADELYADIRQLEENINSKKAPPSAPLIPPGPLPPPMNPMAVPPPGFFPGFVPMPPHHHPPPGMVLPPGPPPPLHEQRSSSSRRRSRSRSRSRERSSRSSRSSRRRRSRSRSRSRDSCTDAEYFFCSIFDFKKDFSRELFFELFNHPLLNLTSTPITLTT